ncbi:MAG TPA: polysaccharide biosynthesis/export family protein [Longimicrobiales bacterium]
MKASGLTVVLLAVTMALPSVRPLAGQSAAAAPAAPPAAEALLRPGDVVRLKIWREPDLSGELVVDEGGVVTFPKLGPMRVTTLAPDALKRTLTDEYQKYLLNPSIEITLLRRVTVLGAVRKAGVYPLDPTMTIADALAMAGGVAPEGSTDRVEVRRVGERIATNLDARTRIADTPIRSGDQLYVPERSWLSRNSAVATSAASILSSVAIALLLRH